VTPAADHLVVRIIQHHSRIAYVCTQTNKRYPSIQQNRRLKYHIHPGSREPWTQQRQRETENVSIRLKSPYTNEMTPRSTFSSCSSDVYPSKYHRKKIEKRGMYGLYDTACATEKCAASSNEALSSFSAALNRNHPIGRLWSHRYKT
jgi:hypothetical protein